MPDMFAEVMPHPLAPKTKDGQRQMIMLTSVTRDTEGGNAEKRIVPVTFTTASEDRHGSVFNPEGWDFSGFKRNPVVLWSHMTKIPMIANALDLRRDGDAWRANLQFAEDEWAAGGGFNLAAVIHRLMDANKLRAMSHGFIPKKWKDRQATTIPSFMAENVRYEHQELTEMSPVNVPSNRDSVRSAIGEGILSGNEADFLLGFGFSLHADAPVELRSLPKLPVPQRRFSDVREAMTVALRCCGIDPCCTADSDENEPVTPEDQAAEIQTATDLIGEYLDILPVALDGWKTAEHDQLRSFCSSVVYNAMYSIEALSDLIERWYGVDLEIAVPDSVSVADIQAYGTAAAKDPATRAGAVLNKGNHAKLMQAHSMISEVLDSAKKLEEDPTDNAPRTWTSDDLQRALDSLKIGGAPSGSDATLHAPAATGTTPTGNPATAPTNERGYLPRINVRLDDLK